MRKRRALLVGGKPCIVRNGGRGLLSQKTVGNDRIAIVQTIQALVEHSKSAADDGLLKRLPCESDSGSQALVLPREAEAMGVLPGPLVGTTAGEARVAKLQCSAFLRVASA